MSIIGKWGIFVVVPELVLGAIAYVVMMTYNSAAAFTSALYVVGIAAVISIAFAIARDDEIGVIIATASLTMVLAIFCATSGALVFTIALAIASSAQVFVANKIAK